MKTIAIHLRLETASHRRRMMGIFRHIGETGLWDIRIIPSEDKLHELLTTTNVGEIPDGIISCAPRSDRINAAIRTSRIPFVGIGLLNPKLGSGRNNIGFVTNDNEGAGASAAAHFLSLGDFRSYAFVPDARGQIWSRIRGDAFRTTLARAGKTCRTFTPGASKDDETALSDFITALPKPTALLAAWDGRAADVLHAAHRMKIKVPSELVVLGIDDDELICEHTVPTLSSIRTDAEGTGEAAARILVGFLDGKARARQSSVCRPILGITERGSTQTPAPATNLIQRALAFIEAEAVNGIRTEDVARHLKISRRLLDLRFRQYESQSVAKCIIDRKLEHAKQLLSDSRIPVKDAFARSGFGNVAYAITLFRETVGKTPESWRQDQLPTYADSTNSRKPADTLEQLTALSQKDAAQLQNLIAQLDPSAHFDAKALQQSLRRGETILFVLRRRSRIAASAALVRFTTPAGSHCRIEDVIVDEKLRGKGLGRKLMAKILTTLREMRVGGIELTSRPSRIAANALYKSLGFTLHKTNVYKYDIP